MTYEYIESIVFTLPKRTDDKYKSLLQKVNLGATHFHGQFGLTDIDCTSKWFVVGWVSM